MTGQAHTPTPRQKTTDKILARYLTLRAKLANEHIIRHSEIATLDEEVRDIATGHAVLLELIASLGLCDHMGDVSDDVSAALRAINFPIDWEDLSDLRKKLWRNHGVTTLHGIDAEPDEDDESRVDDSTSTCDMHANLLVCGLHPGQIIPWCDTPGCRYAKREE